MLYNRIFMTHLTLQDETPISRTSTYLTKYIFGCLMFAFAAMMYYGIILLLLRKPQKVKDETASRALKDAINEDDCYARVDKFIFLLYIISFIIYNLTYFMQVVDKVII